MIVHHTNAHLVCRIGSRVAAIPLALVSETMRPLPIEPLAEMPPFVLGVAIVRGAPVPVIDTARLVGVTESNPTRFVTVKCDERTLALSVDAVLGVRAVGEQTLTALPNLLNEGNADVIAAIGAVDRALFLVLETTHLVPEATWSAIADFGAQP